VVRPRYSENYIATISCTWEWTSMDSSLSPCGFRENLSWIHKL